MSKVLRQFGLIGYPLSHSFSEKYFEKKFREEQISDANYRAFPLSSISAFPKLLASQPGLCGLNVTIPYKETVISFLDELDETAAAVGAVNTIAFSNGKTTGFNTDCYGFEMSLKPFLKSHHHAALVLGTGGAAKAVCFVLKKLGIDFLQVSRTPGTGKISYEKIDQAIINAHKIIINTTPLGMHPNVESLPAIPYQFVSDEHLFYDLVYNPAETAFLKKGKESGAATINGLEMLHLQAAKSWEIWNF